MSFLTAGFSLAARRVFKWLGRLFATQQLADAHVAGGSGYRAAGVGAGATDGNILVLAELVETPARILRILPIEVTLPLDEHGVFNGAAWKAEGLLQIPGCE